MSPNAAVILTAATLPKAQRPEVGPTDGRLVSIELQMVEWVVVPKGRCYHSPGRVNASSASIDGALGIVGIYIADSHEVAALETEWRNATVLGPNLCSSGVFHEGQVVQEAKIETSKWLKRQPTVASDFAWQSGYGAFSVSTSLLEATKTYIENQRDHHKRMSFQDEFREICRRHGLDIDERYVWD